MRRHRRRGTFWRGVARNLDALVPLSLFVVGAVVILGAYLVPGRCHR
ncbi:MULTISPECIES: hypothetical protein [unclassified Streptomyces]